MDNYILVLVIIHVELSLGRVQMIAFDVYLSIFFMQYKYGYRLQSLLEVGGAKTLSIERFCSSNQVCFSCSSTN